MVLGLLGGPIFSGPLGPLTQVIPGLNQIPGLGGIGNVIPGMGAGGGGGLLGGLIPGLGGPPQPPPQPPPSPVPQNQVNNSDDTTTLLIIGAVGVLAVVLILR
jgi:hypothetical protein